MHALAARIPETSTWRNAVETAFSSITAFQGKIAEIKMDRELSAEGHLTRIRAAAQAGPLDYLAKLKGDVTREREHLAERRGHFVLPVLDRDDVVGALGQQEIRSWLRSLPIGEAIKASASDPIIAAAALAAPMQLSGLNEDGMARAKDFLTQHLFGEQLAVLDAEDAIIADVAVAIDRAETELKQTFEPDSTAPRMKLVAPGV